MSSGRTPKIKGRPRARAVLFGAAAILVLPLLIGTTAIASATTYRQWTLSGVTFDDGGTLSGTMIIADDGTPQSFDVTTSGGNTGTFGTNHYTGTPSPLGGDGPANGWYLWTPDQVGQQYLNVLLPGTTSAQQGDSLSLPTPNKSWECTNCVAIRYVTAGSIVAGDLVDLSAPEIDYSIDPADPDGNHFWYVGNPTVTFTVTDPDSEITDATGCDPQTVDEDTDGVEITCQATSGGGTNSNSVFIRRDATPPTLAPGVTPKRVLLHGPINVAPNADDATSGVAIQRCSASTGAAGATVATCSAVDLAGNKTKAKVPYTVEYVLTPIALSSPQRAGHDVQIAIRLTDAAGNRISDRAAAALGCRVTFALRGAQTRNGCLAYHPTRQRFRATMTLGRATGAATLRVSVTYPRSSVKTTEKTPITITG